jgi:hypothetical protein
LAIEYIRVGNEDGKLQVKGDEQGIDDTFSHCQPLVIDEYLN